MKKEKNGDEVIRIIILNRQKSKDHMRKCLNVNKDQK
jgi:hypothetical protein